MDNLIRIISNLIDFSKIFSIMYNLTMFDINVFVFGEINGSKC